MLKKISGLGTLLWLSSLPSIGHAGTPQIEWSLCDQSTNLPLAVASCTQIAENAFARGDRVNAAAAFILLGDANARTGTTGFAVDAYTKAIGLNPNAVEAYNNRGNVFRSLGRVDEAIADFGKVIELRPDAVEPYNNRGLAYEAKGLRDNAIADYSKALSLNPSYIKGLINRGHAYYDGDQFDNALIDLNKAIELAPDAADALFYRGQVQAARHNYGDALANYDKAAALDPANSDIYAWRSSVQLASGVSDKAIADLDRALQLNPRNVNALYGRGLAYEMVGQAVLAIRDYKAAIALLPTGSSTATQLEAKIRDLASKVPPVTDSVPPQGFFVLRVKKPILSRGRCDMGTCAWSKYISTKILASANGEVDVVAVLQGGSSADTQTGRSKVKWNARSHQVGVKCSYTRPTVAVGSEATQLPLNTNGVPGILEDDASVYFEICHSDFNGFNLATKYNYHISE